MCRTWPQKNSRYTATSLQLKVSWSFRCRVQLWGRQQIQHRDLVVCLFPMGAIPYYTVYINMFKQPFKPQINWFIIIGGMPSLSLAHTNMIGWWLDDDWMMPIFRQTDTMDHAGTIRNLGRWHFFPCNIAARCCKTESEVFVATCNILQLPKVSRFSGLTLLSFRIELQQTAVFRCSSTPSIIPARPLHPRRPQWRACAWHQLMEGSLQNAKRGSVTCPRCRRHNYPQASHGGMHLLIKLKPSPFIIIKIKSQSEMID